MKNKHNLSLIVFATTYVLFILSNITGMIYISQAFIWGIKSDSIILILSPIILIFAQLMIKTNAENKNIKNVYIVNNYLQSIAILAMIIPRFDLIL